jgi:coproporphyrinogen III oxidase
LTFPAAVRLCEPSEAIQPCGLKLDCFVAALLAMTSAMEPLDEQQQAARDWFESLRTRICEAFEALEREAASDSTFAFIPWQRSEPDGSPGGGGVRGQMAGKLFEKVGVNVSTVGGRLSEEFAATIPGAQEDPRFFATGISLVAHMANPHVPAVHMNTRFLTTTKRWFGGGADLNPAIAHEEDTQAFHARLRAACAAHDPTFYPRFSKWAEEYFFIPHRGVPRGVGGIFYDRLECAEPGQGASFEANFAFTRDVGEAFLDIFPRIVRKRMDTRFDEDDRRRLLEYRGRYVEFSTTVGPCSA